MPIPEKTSSTLGVAEQLWAHALTNRPSDLSAPSGCGQWSVGELVNHVAGGGHRYALLLAGAGAADTGATRSNDYVGTDAVATFWGYEQLMRSAAERADLSKPVDHRAGPRSGTVLLTMRVMDLTLHARDLAVASDSDWRPAPELTEFLLIEAAPVIAELRGLGLFAAPLEPASDAPADRLLALAGRPVTSKR